MFSPRFLFSGGKGAASDPFQPSQAAALPLLKASVEAALCVTGPKVQLLPLWACAWMSGIASILSLPFVLPC